MRPPGIKHNFRYEQMRAPFHVDFVAGVCAISGKILLYLPKTFGGSMILIG